MLSSSERHETLVEAPLGESVYERDLEVPARSSRVLGVIVIPVGSTGLTVTVQDAESPLPVVTVILQLPDPLAVTLACVSSSFVTEATFDELVFQVSSDTASEGLNVAANLAVSPISIEIFEELRRMSVGSTS